MIDMSELFDFVNEKKFKDFLLNIYRGDSSIQFEDIISELYLDMYENDIVNIEEEYVEKFLKKIYSNTRKNNHSKIIDDIDGTSDECNGLLEPLNESINETDKKIYEECMKLNLTENEILCVLYMRDKSNLKKYDYSFTTRANSNTMNKVELCNYYESIISKLLKNVNKKILSKVK